MYVKRTAELKLLEEQYAMPGSNLVILYGRKGMGKTALLSDFLEGKAVTYYYEGTDCEEHLQLRLMNHIVQESLNDTEPLDYPLLFSKVIGREAKKAIIVLDEFHTILKNSESIIEGFRLLGDPDRPVMLVLCSSSIRWVENEMIESLGAYAASITGYIKLKEFSFVDFVNRFSKSSVETCIYIDAILGGIPQYLDYWQESLSVEDNIKSILLNKNSGLFYASIQFLKLELREPAVYNTILYALAQGNRKLNDLHARTGFSRAKISVYLKNLIQLDIVEKLVPLGEEGKENAQKGLYRIKDNYLSFWFRFVFPNLSELQLEQADMVYESKIAPFLNEYMGEYFADVCTEFLKLMNQHNRLPEKYLWWDRWYGKNGTIDILALGENKKTLVGRCLWMEQEAQTEEYDRLLELTQEARVSPEYCYLFSKSGFSKQLRQLAEESKNIMLIALEDL